MSNTFTVEKKSETKSNLQDSPTIRISVDLFEPNENRYPVFNYQKLLFEDVSDTIVVTFSLFSAPRMYILIYMHVNAYPKCL